MSEDTVEAEEQPQPTTVSEEGAKKAENEEIEALEMRDFDDGDDILSDDK